MRSQLVFGLHLQTAQSALQLTKESAEISRRKMCFTMKTVNESQ